MHIFLPRQPRPAGAAVLVSLALLAGACGGSDDDPDSSEPIDTEADDAVVATDAPAATEAPDENEEPAAEEETGVEEGEIETEDVVEEEDAGPVVGGTLRYGLEADTDGLNPTSSSLAPSGHAMANAVFDTLTAWDLDGTAVPYLAESVAPLDGDLSTWQMTLREGITFHDGTPVDSDAVIRNFEAQRSDPLVGLAVRPSYPCSPTSDEGCDSAVEPIERIDDLTVQYNLLEPNAYYPAVLTTALGMVASPTWLDAAQEDATLNQEPVGTGPFIFESRSQDSITRFVRNDDWWNGEVYLDAIEFLPDTDPDSRAQRLLSGELQAMHTSNQATVGDLLDEENIQNVTDETGEEDFAMINSVAPPFDDIRARRALTLATPQEEYDLLIGLGVSRQASQRFIPESKYYNTDVVQEGDDPDGAAALAAEYCAEKGSQENTVLGGPTCSDGKINIELQFSGPSVIQTRISELLDEGWSAAFNVSFDELPQDEHISQVAFGQYNVVTWRQFGAVDPTIDNVWLRCDSIGGISLNWPRFCSEERDALLLRANATEDEAERTAVYQQQTADMNQEYLYIFFQHTIWDVAFAPEVRGQCDRLSPEGVPLRCVEIGRSWHSSVWLAE